MKKITWKDIFGAPSPPPNAAPSCLPPKPPSRQPNSGMQGNKHHGQSYVSDPNLIRETVKVNVPTVKVNVPVRVTAPPTPLRQIPVATPLTADATSTMNSDSLFVIGSDHDICQDYVAHHNNGVKSYIVLADGCSGSKDSDVGARVLVKSHEIIYSSCRGYGF